MRVHRAACAVLVLLVALVGHGACNTGMLDTQGTSGLLVAWFLV
jgi:hypothetical protein